MPFDMYSFWIGFACVLSMTALLQKLITLRNLLLLIASYVLYAKLAGEFLWVLLIITVVSFGMAHVIRATRYKRTTLTITIALLLCVLAYFKYATLVVDTLYALTAMPSRSITFAVIAVPLGISFFLFQAIGYLIDTYRGTYIPTKSLLNYALFLAFFPKILAGPIERASQFLTQIEQKRPISKNYLLEGFFLILWGLFKKMVIAAHASTIADAYFQQPSGIGFAFLFAALAFTLQLYADFSGYSDIAKGMASMLGFELSWNFRVPYAATNPSDFWKRWHISLSEWFRDYVYIPLGGNRKGHIQTAINLLLTMGLVGLWHGAGWMFVLWGLYWGVLTIIYNIAGAYEPLKPLWRYMSPIALPFFFCLIVFGWVLFRSESLSDFLRIVQGTDARPLDLYTLNYLFFLWAPVLCMDIVDEDMQDRLWLTRKPAYLQLIIYWFMLYAIILLSPITLNDFIYTRF